MTARLESARRISAVIAGLEDSEVRALVATAKKVGIGIGGTTRTTHIDGAPVFIKQLPITVAERADPLATVNHNGLPFVSHYGIGSPSHGVGRELAAHQMTSSWVCSGAVDFFPLLLGWRNIDLKTETDLSEFAGDGPQHRWGSSWPQVAKKLAEMTAARSSMVLFLEYVPGTLGSSIRTSLAGNTREFDFTHTVKQIIEATAWMKKQGFQHFDVHPGNILVNEGRLLFTDFGLSLHPDFVLTPDEESAMPSHADFDRDTALMHLFHWVLFELGYSSAEGRLALLRAAAGDGSASELDPVRVALGSGADLIADHAGVVVRMTEMFALLIRDAFGARYEGAEQRGDR